MPILQPHIYRQKLQTIPRLTRLYMETLKRHSSIQEHRNKTKKDTLPEDIEEEKKLHGKHKEVKLNSTFYPITSKGTSLKLSTIL